MAAEHSQKGKMDGWDSKTLRALRKEEGGGRWGRGDERDPSSHSVLLLLRLCSAGK